MRYDSRGSISLLVLVLAMMMMLCGLAVADGGSFLVARARAQAAAESAALAAVAQQVPILNSSGDPERAARMQAQANGAQLTSCDCKPGQHYATVEVTMTPRVLFLEAWTGRSVRATATASADDALFSYRGSSR